MYRCKNCGGQMHYDIALKAMKCDHCDTQADPESLDAEAGWKASDGIDSTQHICPNCGGTIETTDDSVAAAFCSYCGSNVMLEKRINHFSAPESIIPFACTREDAEKSYRKKIRGNWFVSSRLRKQLEVSEFRGIYMPYHEFYGKVEARTRLPLETHIDAADSSEEYTTAQERSVSGEVRMSTSWHLHDASQAFPDWISEEISDYRERDARPFTPAYLSGFWADTEDVNSGEFRKDAEDQLRGIPRAAEIIGEEVKSSLEEAPDEEKMKTLLASKMICRSRKVYLPVWFLSAKHRDKVCYAVVNGSTGKIKADLPVSFARFLLAVLAASGAVFAFLFAGGGAFRPYITVLIAIAAAVVMQLCMNRELYSAGLRQTIEAGKGLHVSVRGNEKELKLSRDDLLAYRPGLFRMKASRAKKEKKAAKKIGAGMGCFLSVLTIMVVLPMIGAFFSAISVSDIDSPSILAAAGLILFVLSFIQYHKLLKAFDLQSLRRPGVYLAFAAVLYGTVLVVFNPLHDIDLAYYISSFAVVLAILWQTMDVIACHNAAAASLPPHFSTHREENSHA